MEVLPAIDLRGGKVVRLAQGDYDRQTTYSEDPLAVAEAFVAAGVRWIHVVDLDAARSGTLTNTRILADICRHVAPDVKVQCGGRLGGAEIARTEGYHEGRVPLHTMRADIDYAECMAKTTYGAIGVKVWIYRGEVQDDRRGQTYTAGGAK